METDRSKLEVPIINRHILPHTMRHYICKRSLDKRHYFLHNNFMLLVFFYYSYLFSSWSLYRFLTHLPEPVDEFLFKPVIWLLPILIIVVWYEKRSITESLGLDFRNARNDVVYGADTSIGLYIVVVISAYTFSGALQINPLALTSAGILIYALTSLATAVTEEITFRGFIMTRLSEAFKSHRLANIISTVIFLAIHLPILSFHYVYKPEEIAKILFLSGIISLVYGYLFYKRSGVIAPIASHAVWNFIAVLIR